MKTFVPASTDGVITMTSSRILGALAGLAMGAILAVPAAQALTVYSFENDGSGGPIAGSISWDGAPTTGIIASNLDVAQIQLDGSATIACTGCVLNLTTGAFINSAGFITNFAAGGSYSITGDVGNGNELLAGGPTGTAIFVNFPGSADFTVAILEASFVSQSVQDAFGQPYVGGAVFDGFASVNFINTATTGFASSSIEDFDAHLEVQIGEPRALALLGVGLLGIAVARRRKVCSA
jgi:hypothetical protein